MSSSSKPNTIVKYYSRYPKKSICEWKKILFEYVNDSNRPTVSEFCMRHNVNHTMFYEWRNKLYPDFSVKKVFSTKVNRSNVNQQSDSRFIQVKAIGDIGKANDNNEVYRSTSALPKADLPKISSSFSISLPSSITVKFDNGCQLSELTRLISTISNIT